MDDFNHSFADALHKLGIKVTDDEGNDLSKEDFVDYLDHEGMVYKFDASLFETDSVWMTAEDEKGEECPALNEGVYFSVVDDTFFIFNLIEHMAEGSPLEYKLEGSASELRQALSTDNDNDVVAAIKDYCHFDQQSFRFLTGWRALQQFLHQKGVHFKDSFYNYAPIE